MEKELWLDIEGTNGIYQCSNLGNFRKLNKDKRCKKYRILKGSITNKGYLHVNIKGIKTLLAHRIIAKTWILRPYSDCVIINHKNLIRHDNRVDNLEWCTQKHNVNHSLKLGSYENNNGKRVWDVENDIEYLSIAEASRKTGIPYPTLERNLRTKGYYRNLTKLMKKSLHN